MDNKQKMPDFSIYENPIRENIKQYFDVLDKQREMANVTVKQIYDNLELIDFIGFNDMGSSVENDLAEARQKLYDSCIAYHAMLTGKLNFIKAQLGRVEKLSTCRDEIDDIEKVCEKMQLKVKLMKGCIKFDAISLYSFLLNTNTSGAIKEYLKKYPKTEDIAKKINYVTTLKLCNLTATIIYSSFVICCVSLILFVIGKIGIIKSIEFTNFFGWSSLITLIIFSMCLWLN